MSTLTIRNVPEATHARLRERAARHGRSVEAEVRRILAESVDVPQHNILVELHRQIAVQVDVDLEGFRVPERTDLPREVTLP